MKNKKSAKDIAFDRERIKLRSEIKRLNNSIAGYEATINSLLKVTDRQTDIIKEQHNIITELLNYLNIDETELNILIDKEKSEAIYREKMLSAFEILKTFNPRFR